MPERDAVHFAEPAREVLSLWKDKYNTVRPHSGLGNPSPVAYAKASAPRTQRDGALHFEGSDAYAPRLSTQL